MDRDPLPSLPGDSLGTTCHTYRVSHHGFLPLLSPSINIPGSVRIRIPGQIGLDGQTDNDDETFRGKTTEWKTNRKQQHYLLLLFFIGLGGRQGQAGVNGQGLAGGVAGLVIFHVPSPKHVGSSPSSPPKTVSIHSICLPLWYEKQALFQAVAGSGGSSSPWAGEKLLT